MLIERVAAITTREARDLIVREHYSKVMPRLTQLCVGGFVERELVAALSLGWGVRPLHTIARLFPSLTASDYWENGRMALRETMPRNSESQFLSMVCDFVKREHSRIKLIFTWSDGMLGKPGYVYQASGFLYGGFSWTDTYFTATGEKVHPRQTGQMGEKISNRPNAERMAELGWSHYRGKQFRYVRFLCGNAERKRLLRESTVEWTTGGPKHADLAWKQKVNGEWVDSSAPVYLSSANDRYTKRNLAQGILEI